MGTQVTSADQNDSKQQMAVATVAAGATVLAPGEMAVWHGDDLQGRNMESIAALETCRNALKDAGFPEATGEDTVTALVEVGSGSGAVVITNGLLPAVKIDDVFVAYTAGYANDAASKLFMDRIDAAINVLMESTLKAA